MTKNNKESTLYEIMTISMHLHFLFKFPKFPELPRTSVGLRFNHLVYES